MKVSSLTKLNALTLGKIILLNGTSSAGKSAICMQLQKQLDEVWCYYASDQLAEAGFRDPVKKELAGDNEMPAERLRFFDGFHRSIAAFAGAGSNLIVEHIVEFDWWLGDLVQLLAEFDVFFVGVHCPLEEVERRERQRPDRTPGEAAYHMKTHDYCTYDFEVDSRQRPEANATKIIAAWNKRPSTGVFKRQLDS